VIGNSKGIYVKTFWDSIDLKKWLESKDVQVLDIKFAISQGNSERFAVIYRKE